MDTTTTTTNFTGLSCKRSEFRDKRKYSRKKYNEAIQELREINYHIITAKMMTPFGSEIYVDDFYGAAQKKYMRKHAIEELHKYKEKRTSVNNRISFDLKPWLKRDEIISLKMDRAYQWVKNLITNELIVNDPALSRDKFATHGGWRDAIRSQMNKAKIKIEVYTPSKEDIKELGAKQHISVYVSFVSYAGNQIDLTKNF